jgi:hypothetical protein
MTDGHLEVLAMAARHSERQLRDHDAGYNGLAADSAARRVVLKDRAIRMRARVQAAYARRRRRGAQTSGD